MNAGKARSMYLSFKRIAYSLEKMTLSEYGFIAPLKKKVSFVKKITQPNKTNCSI